MNDDRLSDEELAEIERAIAVHKEVRNEAVWPTMPYVSPIRVATMEAMAAELRERRKADLTAEDIVHIEDARAFMVIALIQAQKVGSEKGANSAARIIATLDKVIGGSR